MKSKRTLVVIGLIVVVTIIAGLFFLNGNNDQEQSQRDQASRNQPESTNTTAKQTDQAVNYEGEVVASTNERFSVKVPNGWKTVINCTNNDLMFVSDSNEATLDYNAQEVPNIEQRVCGGDSRLLVFIAANQADLAKAADPAAEEFVTANGVTGTKICKDNVASSGISDETLLLQCTYRFEKDNVVYELEYVRPNQTYADRTELIDRVAKSLVL